MNNPVYILLVQLISNKQWVIITHYKFYNI